MRPSLPVAIQPAIKLGGTSKSIKVYTALSTTARLVLQMLNQSGTFKDGRIYTLGLLLGLVAGFLDVKFGDLLLSALFVLTATMLLGALRPRRPWRWTLLVTVFVPLVQGVAYLLLTEKPYRAQIYESFLGFLTGIAGAYGGSTARRGLVELFRER